jgi:HPt (histidine-containing phosphotransfer) domain-containing protein
MDEDTTEVEAFWSVVLERTVGNTGLAAMLTRKLFEELPRLLEEAETALQERNFVVARRAVHKLAGDAAIFRLKPMHDAAYALENRIAAGQNDVGELCGALRETVQATLGLRTGILRRAAEAEAGGERMAAR